MRTLRGNVFGTRVSAFLLLVLVSAVTMTISDSRPSYAESPSLLGTVRCVVRTVLLTDCQKETPVTEPAQVSNPSTPAQGGSQSSSGKTTAESSLPTSQSKGSFVPTAGNADVPLPEQPATMSPDIRTEPTEREVAYDTADHLAYFNTYSRYAVAGQETSAEVPVAMSEEGWRVFGVSWYWWTLIISAIVVASWMLVRQIRRRAVRA